MSETMDWQPIDTAPKDGTAILFYEPVEDKIVTARWLAQPETKNGGAWYTTDPMDYLLWCQYPTHWMPLPAPPSPPTQKDTP